MLEWMRVRATYANVMATIAVVVAVGTGGAYAAHEVIDGSDVVNESLTGDDIKGDAPEVDGTIKGEDVKDGTLNSKDVGVGGINGSRILDESVSGADTKNNSITGADVENLSLGLTDLSEQAKNRFLQASGLGDRGEMDQLYGVAPAGGSDRVGIVVWDAPSATAHIGWVTLFCKESGMTIRYENNEDAFSGAGSQRIWVPQGSPRSFQSAPASSNTNLLDTTSASPSADGIEIRVESVNKDVSAVFDVAFARVVSSGADQCYWHATSWNENDD